MEPSAEPPIAVKQEMLTLGEYKAVEKPGGVLDLPEEDNDVGVDRDEGSGDRNTLQSPGDIPGERGCVLNWLIVTAGEFEFWLEGEFEGELGLIFFFFCLVGVEGCSVGSVVGIWEGGPARSSDSLLPAML